MVTFSELQCPIYEKHSDYLSPAPLSSTLLSSAPGAGQQVHKWPLRPGVHVHVNGLNTLTGGTDSKINHQISGESPAWPRCSF